jgi:hypothetical protein
VNSKAKVLAPFGDDCEFCSAGTTPSVLTATCSGLTDCGCENHTPGKSYEAVGVAAAVNGIDFYVPQTGVNCIWQLLQEGDFGLVNLYNTVEDCSGAPDKTYEFDKIRITIVKASNTTISVTFRAYDKAAPTQESLAFCTGGVETCNAIAPAAGISDCMSFTVANQIACTSTYYACSGGSCAVQEGMV